MDESVTYANGSAPSTITDTNALQNPLRFYRVIQP